MIQQVRLTENYLVSANTVSTRTVFAFGTHPMATEAEAHPVTSARAVTNKLRIIVDELLVGNNLEEIACRGAVDADAYSRVPLGSTPDDVAKCSSAQDVLPRTCKGEFAVCMCENAAGCTVGTETIAMGAPVGVLDINQDGATDDTRLIQGSVSIRCGAIDVPLDLDVSYWNPSGNQLVPAMGGFDALGPAIVLVPQRGFPTNLECALQFATDITDKQGEQVCAPAGGDVDAGCSPGDVGAFKFKVEPLTFESQIGTTGVSRTDPLLFIANTVVDGTTLAGITIVPAPPGAVTITLSTTMRNINIATAGGLAANTMYTVTIPLTVKDTFGQSAPAPVVTTFTTGN